MPLQVRHELFKQSAKTRLRTVTTVVLCARSGMTARGNDSRRGNSGTLSGESVIVCIEYVVSEMAGHVVCTGIVVTVRPFDLD